MSATTLSAFVNDASPNAAEATAPDGVDARPALASLVIDLTRDANDFAKAEMAYFKAQAGERAQYAVPAFIMIGIAIAIATGVLMALPVGCMLLLAPLIGLGWALLAVTVIGLLLAYAMIKLGTRRLKAVLKSPEDR
jgi:Putative Actinobacterial Holin-X, holin superfamily III